MADKPADAKALGEAISALDGAIRAQRVRGAHLFADIAALSFAHQVWDHAKATLVVHQSDAPGAAYPVARYAWESGLDLMYLTKATIDYDLNGARAYVAARVAEHASIGLMNIALARMRAPPRPKPKMTLRDALKADAAMWSRLAPGKGKLIDDAHKLVKAARSKGNKHWTGLSRDELHGRLEQMLADTELGPVFRSSYDILSSRSHSHLRLRGHVSVKREGVSFRSTSPSADPVPVALAYASTTSAEVALRELLPLCGGRGA